MLHIHGPQSTEGSVTISGSKNATLPLIACGLFFQKFTLHNVPRIGDVFTFLTIITSLGVVVRFEKNTLTMDMQNMNIKKIDFNLVKKIRVGIFLFPALLKKFGKLELPFPGGCNIGKRPIDEHIHAFHAFGYKGTIKNEILKFFGKTHKKDIHISAGFAVTATENSIMMAAFEPFRTTINFAAIEPHVINLIDFLRSIGVKITILYNNTIIIEGRETIPESAETTVIADYIESGTFIILGALTAKKELTIQNARIQDLGFFLHKCQEAGVVMDIDRTNDRIVVKNSCQTLRATNIQTNICPGFPTDLQSPFALLLTQAEGASHIHEILFEGRLNWLIEIEKMKGHIAILNPHEALVFGKTSLCGATVSSWDLRAGVTMIIAGLIARGETHITNVQYIERGYENIVEKIKKIGGNIQNIFE